MKRIHRVTRVAVASMALAACSAEITGPSFGREQPSLLTVGATATESFLTGVTATGGCGSAGDGTTVSSTSTYIVAYGGLQFVCAAPVDTAKTVAAPVPTDTGFLKLSFQ